MCLLKQAVDEYATRLCRLVYEYNDNVLDNVSIATYYQGSIQAVFILYCLSQVRNELGRCRALTAAYNAVHAAGCLDTLNGLVKHSNNEKYGPSYISFFSCPIAWILAGHWLVCVVQYSCSNTGAGPVGLFQNSRDSRGAMQQLQH